MSTSMSNGAQRARSVKVVVVAMALVCAIPLARGTFATGTESTTGAWRLTANESDVLPVHAMVIPTDDHSDQILAVAGSGNDPTFYDIAGVALGRLTRGLCQGRLSQPILCKATSVIT